MAFRPQFSANLHQNADKYGDWTIVYIPPLAVSVIGGYAKSFAKILILFEICKCFLNKHAEKNDFFAKMCEKLANVKYFSYLCRRVC